MFSLVLSAAIRQVIELHAQELGDELDGVEETVGDFLTGDSYKEYRKLVDEHGFDKVTKAIKQKYI